jgi:hypothetical protein
MARSSVFSLALIVLTTRFAAAQEDKAPGPPPKPAEEKAPDKPPPEGKRPAKAAQAKAPPEEKPAEDSPPSPPKPEPEPVGLLKLSEELRSSTLTGKFKEIDVAARNAKISSAGVGSLVETPVRQPTRAALVREGRLDKRLLGTEVRRWLPDLEVCRTTVARGSGVTPAEVSAGTVGLRWTILPSGGARGALVLEQDATDLELMKCARKRMSAWRFTAPVDGPVEVAYSYTFAALPPPPPRPAVATDGEAKPEAAEEAKEQSGAAKAPPAEKKDEEPARAEKKDETRSEDPPPQP